MSDTTWTDKGLTGTGLTDLAPLFLAFWWIFGGIMALNRKERKA